MLRDVRPWFCRVLLLLGAVPWSACVADHLGEPAQARTVPDPARPFAPYILDCAAAPASSAPAPVQTLLTLLASHRATPCDLVSDYGALVAESVGFYTALGGLPPDALAVPYQPSTDTPDPLPMGRYLVIPSHLGVLDTHREAAREVVAPAALTTPISRHTLHRPDPEEAAAHLTPGTLMLPDATDTLRRFSYVYGDPATDAAAAFSLAGMSGRDLLTSRLETTLRLLRLEGVTMVVSLTETAPPSDAFTAYGIGHAHLPVRDFTAPELVQIEDFIALIEAERPRGRVVVHCGAGLGRTGTFLAAFFVHLGQSAEEAIATVRALRPGSIETDTQEAMVATYAAHITDVN